jgi:hypothetical protein
MSSSGNTSWQCTVLDLLSTDLGHHFMKLEDFKDISVSRLLHFVQSSGLLNKWIQGLHKGSKLVDVHGTLWCPPSYYSILLYSILYCLLSNTIFWQKLRNSIQTCMKSIDRYLFYQKTKKQRLSGSAYEGTRQKAFIIWTVGNKIIRKAIKSNVTSERHLTED